MLTKKHIIKYKSKLLRKSWLLLLGFIFLFGVANAGSIDVHKVKGNTENKALPVEYALLGTDYAVTDFVTYANSASEVPPVIRKYSSYFGIVYTMGRIGGSLYSSAKLATAEEAAFAESAAKASTSEITTEETATATTVTSTEEKVTATSTEETAPTTPAKETTASEGTTTGTTTKENVPVETKTTVINDGSVAKGAEGLVKNVLTNRILKTINKYDNKLGQLVEYPKYNNVALGKSSGGTLKQFGDEVGANVWTSETENVFTSMYDLPESWSFERSITSVLNETVGTNQGKILFDISGVNIQKAITGGLVHDPLGGLITEYELQLLMRNKIWYDNVIFHEGGKILTGQEKISKGIKYLEQ